MKAVWSVAKVILFAVLVAFAFDNAGWLGLGGVLLLIVGFALWRLYTARDQFMITLRYIESMIWGKPLDKEYWEGKEWENRTRRKLKFVWKKKPTKNLKNGKDWKKKRKEKLR